MRFLARLRLAAICAVTAIFAFGGAAGARTQRQNTSLGEEARRLREQQKPVRPGTKVWTNDDIPSLPVFGVSVVGQLPESLTSDKDSKSAGDKDKDTEKKSKDAEAALAEAKAHLDAVTHELDLLQREESLDEQQFLSNPNNASDAQGKAKIDAEKTHIAAKQQEVQQAKDKVAEAEAALAKLKGSAPANPPSSPQP
jgi:hypothetical protein